jgi:hypothetical protein
MGKRREIIFTLNIWPISIKLDTNISCMMGIQVCPNPLQRGDNHKSAKIG